jgi:hypothetical protein
MTTKKQHKEAMSVAEYFDAQVNLRQMTLAQLSKDIGGVLKPNMLSMIRAGHTKVPLIHVGRIARALGIDPMFLMKMALQEYQPDNWKAIQEVFGDQPVLTRNEIALINAIREANPNNPRLNDADAEKFAKVVATLHGDNE